MPPKPWESKIVNNSIYIYIKQFKKKDWKKQLILQMKYNKMRPMIVML